MNILVIGASGRVGSKLVEGLLEDNHKVTGTTRKKEKLFDSSNYTQLNLDLTADLKEIEASIPSDTEAIYFTAGSRGKDLLKTDLHGAVKTMKAAENLNIDRYIMLSALFSLEPEKWTTIIDYYTAKHFADLFLLNTKLDYTILQPTRLVEEEGSGKIEINTENPEKNSIENVAMTLKEVLDKKNTFKKTLPMHDGDTPIAEAVSNL